jgi:hypothetical protein
VKTPAHLAVRTFSYGAPSFEARSDLNRSGTSTTPPLDEGFKGPHLVMTSWLRTEVDGAIGNRSEGTTSGKCAVPDHTPGCSR